PDPLPRRLRPHFFVLRANLRWPVRHVVILPGFDREEQRQRAGMVPECQARLLRPALAFTPFAVNVRDACRLSESGRGAAFVSLVYMDSPSQAAATATISISPPVVSHRDFPRDSS